MRRVLETARELALAMPARWGLDAPAHQMIGGDDEISAIRLDALPAEIWANPSDAYILSFVSKGEERHRQWHNDRIVHDGPLPEGVINIVPAGVRPRAVLSEPIQVTHIYMPKTHVARVAAQGGVRTIGGLELIDPLFAPDPVLAALCSCVAGALGHAQPLGKLYMDSLFSAITAHVLQHWSNLGEHIRPVRGGLSSWQTQRAIQYLDASLADEPTLEELARSVGVSTFHFVRSFKASTGVPPHRYLVERRIERARDLLRTTDLPIGEIAASVGYDDPSYFARLFRREVGVTPAAYRRERRR